jgi:hypothetical protein
MSDEIKVRIGTPEDVHSLMELAMLACDENGFVAPNPMKLLNEIYPALTLQSGIVGVIGAPGEKPEAAILLRVGHVWYSDNPVLEERAIFVHPDFRSAKGGRAAKLCRFAKETSDKMQLPLMIGVLSNDRTAAKIRMYERQFGAPTGVYFLYQAQTGGWKEAS